MYERINLTPVTVPRCAAEWPEKISAAARKALRTELADAADILKDNTSADAAIETIWNAIVKASGHDDLAQSN